MKTLQDCLDKVAKGKYIDWPFVEKWAGRLHLIDTLQKAAELYGRYMRFVGHYNMKGRYILFETVEYYPAGGMGDAMGSFDTIQECIDKYNDLDTCESCYIYDRLTDKELGIELEYQSKKEAFLVNFGARRKLSNAND